MSNRALMLACAAYLRTSLDDAPWLFEADEIGIQPEGKPPASMGWKYIALHCLSWEPGGIDCHVGIHEKYTIGVTITVKAGEVPEDDLALYNWYLGTDGLTQFGMEELARKIIVLLHQNYTIVTDANTLIDAFDVHVHTPGSDNIQRFLEWIGIDPEPKLQDASWVYSEPDDGGSGVVGAYTITIRFRGGDRLQRRSIQE